MIKNKSLIEELYTDSGGFNAERAVSILKALNISVQRGEHTVFFKKDLALKAEDKILAFSLIKKLLKSEGVVDSSSVSGKDIKTQTELKAGTVDATMKKLRQDGLLVGSGSSYDIPAHQVETVVERLEKYIPKDK